MFSAGWTSLSTAERDRGAIAAFASARLGAGGNFAGCPLIDWSWCVSFLQTVNLRVIIALILGA
jgi:hypothetical protein